MAPAVDQTAAMFTHLRRPSRVELHALLTGAALLMMALAGSAGTYWS